jgi:hypothetical protein
VIVFITVAHFYNCSRHIFAAKSLEKKARAKLLQISCTPPKVVFSSGKLLEINRHIIVIIIRDTRARAHRQVFFSPFQSNRERSRFKQSRKAPVYRAATPKKKKKKDVFWRLC